MPDRRVVLELAGEHKLARDLVAGGVFVPGYDLPLNEDCELILRGVDAAEVHIAARVVWSNGSGIGLQLLDCDAEMKQRISTLASQPTQAAEVAPTEVAPAEAEEPAEAEQPATDDDAAPDPADEPQTEGEKKLALNMHERLRGLSLQQQIKYAQHGEVSERNLLERMYGKNVWEALLRNPRLTGPEVARIARMGSLPRPLMEIILNNGGWLQIPEVRRALLTNPRLGTDQIMRILRLLPKHEIKMAATQTVYPLAVRDVAKRLIKDAGG